MTDVNPPSMQALAKLERIAVIQMQSDRDIRVLR